MSSINDILDGAQLRGMRRRAEASADASYRRQTTVVRGMTKSLASHKKGLDAVISGLMSRAAACGATASTELLLSASEQLQSATSDARQAAKNIGNCRLKTKALGRRTRKNAGEMRGARPRVYTPRKDFGLRRGIASPGGTRLPVASPALRAAKQRLRRRLAKEVAGGRMDGLAAAAMLGGMGVLPSPPRRKPAETMAAGVLASLGYQPKATALKSSPKRRTARVFHPGPVKKATRQVLRGRYARKTAPVI